VGRTEVNFRFKRFHEGLKLLLPFHCCQIPDALEGWAWELHVLKSQSETKIKLS